MESFRYSSFTKARPKEQECFLVTPVGSDGANIRMCAFRKISDLQEKHEKSVLKSRKGAVFQREGKKASMLPTDFNQRTQDLLFHRKY